MLKFIIAIIFILLLISLFGSLFLVYKDKGRTARAFFALSTRAGLAVLLLALIIFGLATDRVGIRPPWSNVPPMQQKTSTKPASTIEKAPLDSANTAKPE
jgi:cytochrome bd-type quinol oxidase subunit 2